MKDKKEEQPTDEEIKMMGSDRSPRIRMIGSDEEADVGPDLKTKRKDDEEVQKFSEGGMCRGARGAVAGSRFSGVY